MSYMEYGAQTLRYALSFAGYVHSKAHPLCAGFTEQTGKQWPPLQTALNVVGTTTFTYILEALFLALATRIVALVLRTIGTTLYRVIRLMFIILFVVLALSLGLYVYLTDASNSQALADLAKGNFWLNQVSSYASMVTPIWNDELAKWQQGSQKKPNKAKFNYQTQAYM
ncbi:hypothetical protein GGI22_004046 [Coemansia erecta]|nr:hypothetical protein GGI22_004046 [Coemansia erecta]